jgi:hypothetical protein
MHGKTMKKKTNFQSRTAVLLQEDNIPPATWKLGITKINQGSGRLVKTVTTHTRQGTFKQTVNNCVSLLRIIYITPLKVSHESNPSFVPRGIIGSYSALPWVTWEAVTVVEGIP